MVDITLRGSNLKDLLYILISPSPTTSWMRPSFQASQLRVAEGCVGQPSWEDLWLWERFHSVEKHCFNLSCIESTQIDNIIIQRCRKLSRKFTSVVLRVVGRKKLNLICISKFSTRFQESHSTVKVSVICWKKTGIWTTLSSAIRTPIPEVSHYLILYLNIILKYGKEGQLQFLRPGRGHYCCILTTYFHYLQSHYDKVPILFPIMFNIMTYYSFGHLIFSG